MDRKKAHDEVTDSWRKTIENNGKIREHIAPILE